VPQVGRGPFHREPERRDQVVVGGLQQHRGQIPAGLVGHPLDRHTGQRPDRAGNGTRVVAQPKPGQHGSVVTAQQRFGGVCGVGAERHAATVVKPLTRR
jgi:hypothetical protein